MSTSQTLAGVPSTNAAPAERRTEGRQARFNRLMGYCWIVLGLLCNEFVLRPALGLARVGWIARIGLGVLCAAAIGWGLLAIRGRARPAVTNTNLAVAAILLSVLSAEAVLRQWPTLLGHTFANGILTKYTDRPGGIYYWDPATRMPFMFPNHRTRMYYHGYTWEHRTDALGFRNRVARVPADMMLLGDSFIYGHGVDLESTVGHFLEQCSGASVMNLARQGDYALYQAYLLSEYAAIIRPRVVVYFFFENDIRDAYRQPLPELLAFAATPVEAIRFPPRTNAEAAIRRTHERWLAGERDRGLLEWVRQTPYLSRIWDWWRYSRGTTELMRRMRDEAAYDVDNESSPGWQLTKTAILYMKGASERHGARFVMAPITMVNVKHADILRRFAEEHAIERVDTSRITVAADPSLFLVEDGAPGHFSPKGARVMAETVCTYLAGR